MKDSRKALLFMSVIGTMADLVFKEEVNSTGDDIIHALQILGLDGERLMREQPIILSLHEVCQVFGNMQVSESVLHEIMDDVNAEDDTDTE